MEEHRYFHEYLRLNSVATEETTDCPKQFQRLGLKRLAHSGVEAVSEKTTSQAQPKLYVGFLINLSYDCDNYP